METRLATETDMREFYGRQKWGTCRAMAWTSGGSVLGIGGVAYRNGMAVIFVDLKPEARAHRKSILRGARWALGQLRKTPAIAIADGNEPGAERFLTKLGFIHLVSSPEGEVYKWPA